jgi:hypothetical protein
MINCPAGIKTVHEVVTGLDPQPVISPVEGEAVHIVSPKAWLKMIRDTVENG